MVTKIRNTSFASFFYGILLLISNTEEVDHFSVEKMYMCEDFPNQTVKIYLTPRYSTPSTETVDINVTSPKPIGYGTQLKATGFMEISGRWLPIFKYEEDFCTVFKNFVGRLFEDMERAAGILPGTCPIPKGTYHLNNYTLNFQNLKVISVLASGRMKIKLEGFERVRRLMMSCVVVLIRNSKLN